MSVPLWQNGPASPYPSKNGFWESGERMVVLQTKDIEAKGSPGSVVPQPVGAHH